MSKNNIVKKVIEGAKNAGYKAVDAAQRGKLGPRDIPLQHQPDFVKKRALGDFSKTVADKAVKAAAYVSSPGKGIGKATKIISSLVARKKQKKEGLKETKNFISDSEKLIKTLSKLKRGVKPDDPSFGRPSKNTIPAIGDKVRGWTGNPFALKKTK